ncbi:PAS domain-containing protein [Arcobacter sp. LA11]|uniref:PAS domain-containing protein n=1 Tax=Arcobacter sp. LA11 TaxID=1898176 RepID=UPI00093367D5|nr:PAS domain-containing protein [Arcobacter sp. LA11]
MTKLKAISLTILLIIIGAFLSAYYVYVSVNSQHDLSKKMLLQEARAHFDNIVVTRSWNDKHNGVYIKARDDLRPNKYLLDNHDYTENGELLVKVNHSWMTRQISELLNIRSKYNYKITSLNPLNPDNRANKFEKKALEKFEKEKILEYSAFNKSGTKFNYIGALKVTQSCLQCHALQGYMLGDIRGGIRVTIPTFEYRDFNNQIEVKKRYIYMFIIIISLILALILIWFINSIFSKHETIIKMSKKHEILSQRYEYAINGSYDGLWDWDLLTNKVYFSKIWKGMLGYQEHELANSLETWEWLVHPDDFEQARQDIKANHEGKTHYYENIHRLKHKDGYWVWILDRGRTIFEDGTPIRMVGFHTDITKQKELELTLKQSQKNLEKAEKMANLGHWRLDIKTKKLMVSSSIKDILGLDEKDKIDVNDLLKTLVHDDDKERVLNKYLSSIKKGKPYRIEYKIVRKNDKEIRYVDCNVEHIKDRNGKDITSIGTIQDVTEFALVQNELFILRQAVEQAPITFVITDIDGYIQYVNPAFTKVTGYSAQEAIGKNPRILKSDFIEDKEYANLWQTISNGKTWSGTFRNIDKNGEEFWELAFISPIISEKDNQIKNYLAIKQEITKEVYLKRELKDKEELMIAQSRHAAMGEMISMIAHQWRQPISVVGMGANNILADIELDMVDNETLKENAEDIINQTQYLSQTIEDFRNFFKPDKEKEILTIKSIFAEALGVIGKTLENNNIELEEEYSSDAKIETFSREVLQVFINIIKNAKEVLIENNIEEKVIKINEYLDKDKVVIEISDNAGGIPKHILEKIFDPYFTTKNELAGTGLGLYMSKTIVEKHLNGTIRAYNKDDGACFEIVFKAYKEE